MTTVQDRAYVIETYRPRIKREVLMALVPGALLVMMGSSLAGLSLVLHLGVAKQAVLISVAAVVVLSGPAWAWWRLTRSLSRESMITLRSDGIAVREPNGEILLAWDAIHEAFADNAAGVVRIALKTNEEFVLDNVPEEYSVRELAQRINRLRIRSAWNMLR